MDVSRALGAHTERVELDGPKVYHIPSWEEFGDPKRMDIITRIAQMRGRDPRIATLAVDIFKKAGVQPRDYVGQAKAILDFVQNDLYYVNEPGERLSDPLRTLKVGYGDCDDLVIVLGAILESVRIPWRVVISGTDKRGRKVRYHHGDKFPGGEKKGYIWSHIYMTIGDRPFNPQKWHYAETTVRGAPLGWDVVDGDASIFPELKSNYGATMYGQPLQLVPTHSNLTASGPNRQAAILGGNVPTTLDPNTNVVTKGIDVGGQRRQRQAIAAGPQQADMVAIVVLAPNGKVLAMHRGAGVSWMAGRWDLPGGKTNGRTARAAAVDILAQETGIVTHGKYLRSCSVAYHPDAGTSAFFVYRLPKKQEILFRKKEHQGYKFLSKSELLKQFRTAPYVDIALRACFAPKSLATSPALTGKAAKQWTAIAAQKVAAVTNLLNQAQTANANGDAHSAKLLQAKAMHAKMEAVIAAKKAADLYAKKKSLNYGAFDMEELKEKLGEKYYNIPLWVLLAGGAGAYYYYTQR
jgi:transglutaminase-like putative cysteine protease